MLAGEVERLFRDHGAMVLRRARQILRSEDEAREALQDIFASLLAAAEPFAARSSPTTFLYSVTTHHCLNRLRNRRTRDRLLGERAPPAAEEPARAEDAAVAVQMLARMPEELAAVIVYYYLDEMSHDEIAGQLGCSRRHVGDLLGRAREWIAKEERRVA